MFFELSVRTLLSQVNRAILPAVIAGLMFAAATPALAQMDGMGGMGGMGPMPVTAYDDYGITPEDMTTYIDILGNDQSFYPLNSLTVELVQGPNDGVVSFNEYTGQVAYTPYHNFYGEDTFTYRVQDSAGTWSNVATVRVSVMFVNRLPMVLDLMYIEQANNMFTFSGRAYDQDGDTMTLFFASTMFDHVMENVPSDSAFSFSVQILVPTGPVWVRAMDSNTGISEEAVVHLAPM